MMNQTFGPIAEELKYKNIEGLIYYKNSQI